VPFESVSAAVDARENAAGWYGKLATLGDFAHRRLPTEFIQLGDTWLSRAMTASREHFGERWLDVYLTAPVMRFAWAPGVAGPRWWFGLLMPSCDNVGRYFPLLIAQSRGRPPLDRIAFDHLEAWFDHLAGAATHTLAERASLALFEQALFDAPPWPTPGAPAALVQRGAAGSQSYQLAAHVGVNHWLHSMASETLQAEFAGCSIWWRRGDPAHNTRVSVVRGLPEPQSFAQMLSGS
jgi:type VI secretion system protein ImpM